MSSVSLSGSETSFLKSIVKFISSNSKNFRDTFWGLFDESCRKWTMGMICLIMLGVGFYKYNTSPSFSIFSYSVVMVYTIYVTGHTLNEKWNGSGNNNDTSDQTNPLQNIVKEVEQKV